jgi:hypothetical protein
VAEGRVRGSPLILPIFNGNWYKLPSRKLQVEPFHVQEVRLLHGPFKHAQEKDAKYLLRLGPDRLLAWFRKIAARIKHLPALRCASP